MLVALAKLIAATAAVLGPFMAGLFFSHTLAIEGQIFLVLSGSAFGLAGLFAYAWIERGEEQRHLARLRQCGRA